MKYMSPLHEQVRRRRPVPRQVRRATRSTRRTRRELGKETSEEVWEQKNDALRRLGLGTIPNPGE